MSLEQWQIALRREFGREQDYRLVNTSDQSVFSDFLVSNPQTRRTYRVAIRGAGIGENHCTCPDFAVNTLGTCKHIEYTLAKLERRRGGKRALREGYHPPFSEIYLRYGARREVVLRRGSELPETLRPKIVRWFDDEGILRPQAMAAFEGVLQTMQRAGHDVRCHEDVRQFIARVRDGQRLRERIDAAFGRGIDSPAFDGLLKTRLYAYQRRGALFLARAGRALLADDMGLGKTVQAIAAAEMLARVGAVERVLIVCPTSLKHQWQQEIERFTGRDAQVIQGLLPARTRAYREAATFKIANYDVLHTDLEMIRKWEPDLVILDEAQRIKNYKTRAARTVKQLDSPCAMVLTGTPLENRLEELHSIVEFVDRHRLGPGFRFLHEHQQLDEDGRVVGYQNLSRINRTLEPILLRRTKQEVLKELPPRMEKYLFIPMTEPQKRHHDENQEIVARIVARWKRTGFLSESDQRRMTCALQNMRMVCNSTYLLDPETESGSKPDELVDQLCEILERKDAKVVVFSQWLRSHELLLRRLERRRIGSVLFHGGVPGPKRRDLVSRFREDGDCRVFLSTDAGGVGLNLQNATAVLNMDLPWNPAVLEQRIGRVHRLGQSQAVQVVHFVSEGSIEQGMLEVLRFKKSLFGGVLDGGDDQVFLGGTRLKRFMQSVESVSGSIPKTAGEDGEARAVEQNRPGRADQPDRPAAAPETEVLAQLVSAGQALLGNLASALASAAGPQVEGNGDGKADAERWRVERDGVTGRPVLKVPLPPAGSLAPVMRWLEGVLKR